MRILTISGSLRNSSSNTRLLQAVAALAPAGVEIVPYEGLGTLPHFNPDLEGDETLTSVQEYRAFLQQSDAVLISSPEYAHGVPGSLKNALDWVVGSGELVGKPVGLINASPRSTFAQASLSETLTVMSANLVPAASVAIHTPVRSLSVEAMLQDPAIADVLRSAIAGLIGAIEAKRAELTEVER